MFTGIVREVGRVVEVEGGDDGRTLDVEARQTAEGVAEGDSVSVSGVCLTAEEINAGTMRFHAVPETLVRTTLGSLGPGDAVNVEPALRAGEPLGGHLVQGHVDALGRVESVEREGEGLRVAIAAPPDVLRYCVEKGSITVDGVSLTVAALAGETFDGRARAVHARRDDTRRGRSRTLGQPRGRRAREVRRASVGAPVSGATMSRVSATTRPETSPFATIEDAIEEIRAGRFVVVADDADRENEGDLTIAAQFVTPDAVNFMATHGRGLICLCLTPERCDELGLRQMTDQNEAQFGTAFTVSIEARDGVSTGISAADRARTIQVAVDPTSTPSDLVQPGHVFPLRARAGGVLQRSGQTEAAVDLARLAGLAPAGVVCEIMKDDGTMARVPDLVEFCARHGLMLVTVADLIEYRRRTEKLVERVVSVRLPTDHGDFQAVAYREMLTGKQHVALVKGDVEGQADVLVRVHSECLTGDVFHSRRCDCGEQLERALAKIEEEGRGVLLYLAQEGRGIGLLNKLRAYELQEQGLDTVEANIELGFKADAREYGIGSQILADLGLSTIRVLTNNPEKISGISGYGLEVVGKEPIEIEPNDENRGYLETKRDKLGHTIGHRLHHQRERYGPDDS